MNALEFRTAIIDLLSDFTTPHTAPFDVVFPFYSDGRRVGTWVVQYVPYNKTHYDE